MPRNGASRLLTRLIIANRGMPKAIISDKDRKFSLDLSQAFFELLNVKLLHSTEYHPQTDGMSERTNQTVEIALRFYIHTLTDPTTWKQPCHKVHRHVDWAERKTKPVEHDTNLIGSINPNCWLQRGFEECYSSWKIYKFYVTFRFQNDWSNVLSRDRNISAKSD